MTAVSRFPRTALWIEESWSGQARTAAVRAERLRRRENILNMIERETV